MNINNLKIEYSIISRGTEKYGSKGYMGITEPVGEKRYFVLANHYEKYVKNSNDSFCFKDEYTIENITLSRFEMITKLALQHNLEYVKEKIVICGFGSIGFSSLIYFLDIGYKTIDVYVREKTLEIIHAIKKLNIKYKTDIKIVDNLSEQYNTYIDTTGSSEVIEKVFKNIGNNSVIFLLGTPRENKYFINPLDIHRKNLKIFGGHELNGHSWNERNDIFIDLLKENADKKMTDFVTIHDSNKDKSILEKVYEKKNNFFEVIKYDIQD